MAQPTKIDLQAAFIYATQRSILNKIQFLYKKYPHIASKLKYTINNANPDTDYYYRETFKLRAIKVSVNIDKTLCDFINCTPWNEHGPCKVTDVAKLIRNGDIDNEYFTVCQPACFNIKDTITYNKSTEPETQMPALSYNTFNKKCMFESPANIWMMFPISRDDARYTVRLNDFDVGFNKVPSNTYISGYKYKYNEIYCEQFNTVLRDDNCVEPWYNMLLGAVVGTTLLNTVSSAIKQITTGTSINVSNLPKPPDIDEKWYLNNWKNDITSNFIVPDPNINIDAKNIEKVITTVTNNRRTLDNFHINKKINYLYKQRPRRSIKLKKNKTKNEDLDKLKELIQNTINDYDNTINMGAWTTISELIVSLFTPEMLMGIGVDYVLAKIPEIIKLLTSRLSSKILTMTASLGSSISTNILKSSIISVTTKVIIQTCGKAVSKIVLSIAKLTALTSSVVGIILAIGTVVDILLTLFWDPYGFNNQFPDGYLELLQSNFDAALRQQTGVSEPEMTFDVLCNYLLEENDVLLLAVEELTWVYEYLDHLIVNSEGSRINKGEEIELNFNEDNFNEISDELAANTTKIYTQAELKEYEENHMKRLKTTQALNIFAISLILLGTGCLYINYLLSIIIIIAAIIIFILSYICICNNIVFDLPLYNAYDKINSIFVENNILGKILQFL